MGPPDANPGTAETEASTVARPPRSGKPRSSSSKKKKNKENAVTVPLVVAAGEATIEVTAARHTEPPQEDESETVTAKKKKKTTIVQSGFAYRTTKRTRDTSQTTITTSTSTSTTTTTAISSRSTAKRTAKPWNPTISPYPLTPVTRDEHKFAKLVSWNVVSLNAIVEKGSLQHYVRQEQPDVICLQETKLTYEKVPLFKGKTFDARDVYPYEYHNCSTARKVGPAFLLILLYAKEPNKCLRPQGYSGVAMYSRHRPLRVHHGIGVEEHDNEGRVITLEFARFYLVGSYIPNSGDGLLRLDYRQRWNRDMEAYLATLASAGLPAGMDVHHEHGHELEYRVLAESERQPKPVIWCGDLNVAHQEIDIHDPANNHYTSGFTDEERDDFTRVLKEMDFVDSYRHENPTQQNYSFWSYRSNARARNHGWRLDYFLYQRALAPFVRKAFIRKYALGSDHCPVGLLVHPRLFERF